MIENGPVEMSLYDSFFKALPAGLSKGSQQLYHTQVGRVLISTTASVLQGAEHVYMEGTSPAAH